MGKAMEIAVLMVGVIAGFALYWWVVSPLIDWMLAQTVGRLRDYLERKAREERERHA